MWLDVASRGERSLHLRPCRSALGWQSYLASDWSLRLALVTAASEVVRASCCCLPCVPDASPQAHVKYNGGVKGTSMPIVSTGNLIVSYFGGRATRTWREKLSVDRWLAHTRTGTGQTYSDSASRRSVAHRPRAIACFDVRQAVYSMVSLVVFCIQYRRRAVLPLDMDNQQHQRNRNYPYSLLCFKGRAASGALVRDDDAGWDTHVGSRNPRIWQVSRSTILQTPLLLYGVLRNNTIGWRPCLRPQDHDEVASPLPEAAVTRTKTWSRDLGLKAGTGNMTTMIPARTERARPCPSRRALRGRHPQVDMV